MKKLIVFLTLSLLCINSVIAETVGDSDGILGAAWNAPTVGNTPTSYVLSYNINGKMDSVLTEKTNFKDSSVVLVNEGDWAVLKISSVYEYWSEYLQRSVREESIPVFSDTVTFNGVVNVNPPTGVHWE
jgi:hypothetical protein